VRLEKWVEVRVVLGEIVKMGRSISPPE